MQGLRPAACMYRVLACTLLAPPTACSARRHTTAHPSQNGTNAMTLCPLLADSGAVQGSHARRQAVPTPPSPRGCEDGYLGTWPWPWPWPLVQSHGGNRIVLKLRRRAQAQHEQAQAKPNKPSSRQPAHILWLGYLWRRADGWWPLNRLAPTRPHVDCIASGRRSSPLSPPPAVSGRFMTGLLLG